MKKLNFSYHMQLTFEYPVRDHHFTLRCFPPNDTRQQILTESIEIYPQQYSSTQTDSFGNRCIYGTASWEHNYFAADVNGQAVIDKDKNITEDAYKTGLFRYQTELTRSGEGIMGFYNKIKRSGHPLETAKHFMDKLFENFVYEQGTTNILTTAEEAFTLGKGVCQDYAHILISLCRLEKIPCRYVAGMMTGEGATHAWTEVFDNGVWHPLDPTHNRLVDDTYIKISSGRDAKDCTINQGVFIGGGKQKQEVRVTVEEIL